MSDQQQPEKEYGELRGPYTQQSIKKRIEALFLDNIGKVLTREQIIEVAKDPETGREPENWHQRLSELRTDEGYTILSHRDRAWLGVGEYMMPTSEKSRRRTSRVIITREAWEKVLRRAGGRCEWRVGNSVCGLREGEIDPVSGGTVKLTPDHKIPHDSENEIDPDDPDQWQALCGRHQVMKKNFWDDTTGKINAYAIVQAATREEKREIYAFLKEYFGDTPYAQAQTADDTEK